jgi:CheY-like chemotaxis protein
VRIAEDGDAALAAAREFRPRVVLLDLGMPQRDGYAVAQALRADPAFEQVVLVALSGYGQASDRARSQAAGFDAHLLKPADLSQVYEVIADGWQRRRG